MVEQYFPDPVILNQLPIDPAGDSTRYGILASLPRHETSQMVDTLWGRLAAGYQTMQGPSPAADPWMLTIGGNEGAATLTGVPVKATKVSVYMFCSFTAGIAGILEVGWLGTITTGLGQGMELTVIAAAVIGGANLAGGAGTAFGAVVGAALIEVIRNSLTLLGISTFWQGTFVGSFIIVAVLFDRLRARGAND